MNEDYENDSWDVDLTGGKATSGAFTVSFYDNDDGGFSLNVIGGAQDLDSLERFGLLQSAMEAIYYAKVKAG